MVSEVLARDHLTWLLGMEHYLVVVTVWVGGKWLILRYLRSKIERGRDENSVSPSRTCPSDLIFSQTRPYLPEIIPVPISQLANKPLGILTS